MKSKILFRSALAALCLASLTARAQDVPDPAARRAPRRPVPRPTPSPDRFSAHVRLGGLYFGNFFQAPEGAPAENVLGAAVEGGVAYRLRENAALEGYVEIDYIVYDDFDPSRGVTLGARSEGRPHAYDASLQVLGGRPSREVRDELDRADVVALQGRYSYRVTDDWEAIGLGEYRHESFERSADKANDVSNLGAAVRYRGFGSRFSPELGVRLGGRDVTDDNEDLSQREAYLRLRWAPSRKAYLTLRYRRRSRDYSIEDPGASNFGREDRRRQWVTTADLKHGKSLVWNLYHAIETSDSTRPQGGFDAQMLFLGLTRRF